MRERLNLEQILKQQALLGSVVDLSPEQLTLLIRRTITSEARCARLEAALREILYAAPRCAVSVGDYCDWESSTDFLNRLRRVARAALEETPPAPVVE